MELHFQYYGSMCESTKVVKGPQVVKGPLLILDRKVND